MKYLLYKTDGTYQVIERPTRLSLAELQGLVGGNIEAYQTTDGASVFINEEGRLEDLPSNPFYPEDLRGNVVETGGADNEGETKSLPGDYVIRKIAALPAPLFEKGRKFTIVWIGSNWGATGLCEIKTAGRAGGSQKFGGLGLPVFSARGKRKESLWMAKNAELLIFEGWDLPFTEGSHIKQSDAGYTSSVIRMNALYNLGGMPKEELAKYLREKQINPFFMLWDHINYIHEDGKTEELLFPHAPATSQRIADMQSDQLKDGKFRIVVGAPSETSLARGGE